VANEDTNLYSYDMRKLTIATCVHKDFVSAVLDIDYSPTGREFVAGSYDRTVRIFDYNGGHSRVGSGGICFSFSPRSLCLIPQIQPIMLGLCPIMPNHIGIFRLALLAGRVPPEAHAACLLHALLHGRQGLTLVYFSAQLEPFMTQTHPTHPVIHPDNP
jgi:hypothetical protein